MFLSRIKTKVAIKFCKKIFILPKIGLWLKGLKYSFATTVFSHIEDPRDRKCSWKEWWGALDTQNWILNILFL